MKSSKYININIKGKTNKKSSKKGFYYSIKQLIKIKKLIFAILISIIYIICYIIISNQIHLFENINLHFINIKDYDKEGIKIYNKTGKLSFNKLDEMAYRKKIDYSKFNNIHIAMSFDNNYYLLSSITISSLLKNAAKSTYIHIHIIAVQNFLYETMKKIKFEIYGVGEFARMMAPELIKDTDRILVFDSGDLFIEKDIYELYNYPLDDKLIKGVIDPYTECFPQYYSFRKENYLNGGLILFNSKKWREMGIYQDIVNFYNSFKYKGKLPTPFQDILNTFLPSLAIGTLPLRYNFQGYYDIKSNKDFNQQSYYSLIYNLHCSLYKGRDDLLIEEEENLVIRHNNKFKIHKGELSNELKKKWNYYANLTGFYDEICKNYDSGCN